MKTVVLSAPFDATQRRNLRCPCGSGKRFKHCCGSRVGLGDLGAIEVPRPAVRNPDRVHRPSLIAGAEDAVREGELSVAISLYRKALELETDDLEIRLKLCALYARVGDHEAAAQSLLEVIDEVRDEPSVLVNLGTSLAAVARQRNTGGAPVTAPSAIGAHRRTCHAADLPPLPDGRLPKVTIVMPLYNHQAYVVEALESVFGQTYRNIELIVIDDGSADRSVAAAAMALKSCPFPHVFLRRENNGAHATINEGIGLARGEFVNILNSDDAFAARRIEFMLAMLEDNGADWGFSRVEFIDDLGTVCPRGTDPYVDGLYLQQDRLEQYPTIGAGFLHFNYSISTGNLFMRRAFFERLGGFRNLRYNHDWDFCLRAILASEPVCLLEQTYRYRMHGVNTIHESRDQAEAEAHKILGEYLDASFAHAPDNILAPSLLTWGEGLAWWLLENRRGHLFRRDYLRELALSLRLSPAGSGQ